MIFFMFLILFKNRKQPSSNSFSFKILFIRSSSVCWLNWIDQSWGYGGFCRGFFFFKFSFLWLWGFCRGLWWRRSCSTCLWFGSIEVLGSRDHSQFPSKLSHLPNTLMMVWSLHLFIYSILIILYVIFMKKQISFFLISIILNH